MADRGDQLRRRLSRLRDRTSTAFYNAFAAVPSLHVGFAFAIGIAGVAAVQHRWAKLLAAAWGPIVSLTVVATGNHYVFDVVAGMVMIAAGFAVWQLDARRGALLARVPRPSFGSLGRVRRPSPREAALTT